MADASAFVVSGRKLVGALDQGTSSTRFILVDSTGNIVASAQREHSQHYAKPGWVAHDALEILENAAWCVQEAVSKVPDDTVVALGITNQRETTVVFDAVTGAPVHHAISWNCARTQGVAAAFAQDHGGIDCLRQKTGLPIASYFSATKLRWLFSAESGLDVADLEARAQRGEVLFGTVDTFLIWHLTCGAVHATDVTNASRTLLCDVHKLQWDAELCALWGVSKKLLPRIEPSVGGDFGYVSNPSFKRLRGVPISAVLGDQHAAAFGQRCFARGDCKATFGTGCFVMLNTGLDAVPSKSGLLTTPLYQIRGEAAVYALEGAVAVAGSAVQWLRDNLGFAEDAHQIGILARTVSDSGGVFFVPAFNGLFAPHWDPSARGIIAGLTAYVTKAHICRATIEASGFGFSELKDSFEADRAALSTVSVDGGMAVNNELMQFIADVLGVDASRPACLETTALGAAFAAGLGTIWKDLDAIRALPVGAETFSPRIDSAARAALVAGWDKAVACAKGWLSTDAVLPRREASTFAIGLAAFAVGVAFGSRLRR